MNQTVHHPTRWDLDRLYPENKDPILSTEIAAIQQLIEEYKENKDSKILFQIIQRIEKAEYYHYCLTIEKTDQSAITLLHTNINNLKTEARILLQDSKTDMSNFTENKNINFMRDELKAWEDMYIQLRNKLEIHYDNKGNKEILSFGKANHLAMNHENMNTRSTVFHSLTETLEQEKNLFALVLNHMGRLRNVKNQMLIEKDVLSESLQVNGISHHVLSEMWNTIEENLEKLTSFLDFQKNNSDTLTWHEFMTTGENEQIEIPFSTGVEEIYDALKNIDEELAQFALQAITYGWVDAEPRDRKSSSGCCVPFLSERESRISLRYDGTLNSVRILAHELGHAWHFYQISQNPSNSFLDDYLPMSMAESASIFFEMVLVDHLVEKTDRREIKKELLNWKIRNSFNYLMAIRASFMFEQSFYEERKKGPLSADGLEKLSIDSQQIAYGNRLTEYQPFVWMKYDQFYTANVPFYNYPYTFGYLLSLGLLEIAKQEGSEFNRKYKLFLSDTGKRPVEELVNQYFQIDLANPDFWRESLLQINKDIDDYIQLEKEEF
ncbi:M3 family metallopeptidase [Bacillus sp. DX1.1]|uniref:M3 family metallopeptidase n=1 Tax=unclassified Bacillus (in: firmicutes) TaxID=185979 RepID=UPI0025703434|nr:MULTISPECIES: M3 family metallopeptidase [unclassified Bacillus (in: firmicutes)]MDM5155218.1 M3 family metallopeptidase [Bacillus sp. DX1.1]WJE84096.1 M3 family metallopeptidase [Bacillus sp. DX3.1]